MPNYNKNSGLYIHIPFCETKCLYCNFFSCTNIKDNDSFKKYLDYLLLEYKLHIDKVNNINIDTIYIGGGTPSIIPYKLYEFFFSSLFDLIDLSSIKEFTIECNTHHINKEILSFLGNYKNIRLSLGVQSLDDNILKKINRLSNQNEIYNAFKCIENDNNINNISLDFICGLPDSSIDTTPNDIKNSLNLLSKTNHISLYYLELEDKINIQKKWSNSLLSEDDLIKSFSKSLNILNDFGFYRYEISSFAKNKNSFSKHNMHYWDIDDYIGLGLSAVGCYNDKRYKNTLSLKTYYDFISNGNLPIDSVDILDHNKKEKEFILLHLRKTDGIDITKYDQIFNEKFCVKYDSVLKKYKTYFNISNNNSLKIKDKYKNYTDEITVLFF